MPDLLSYLLLFGVGLLAGVINVMAGGGSTLSLPALIFLGLDPTVANGTNRVAIVLQNIAATGSFRHEKVSRLGESVRLGLWALPGAILGAFAAVRISDAWFERILGVVLLGVVVSMLLPRRQAPGDGPPSRWTYPALFAAGFYGGFIQVGVGFLLMAVLYHLMRLDLIRTNMHKVTIVLLYTIPALLIFALNGQVDWSFGLSLAAGNATGGWWAARLAVRRGEHLVRYALGAAIVLIALKMLGVF